MATTNGSGERRGSGARTAASRPAVSAARSTADFAWAAASFAAWLTGPEPFVAANGGAASGGADGGGADGGGADGGGADGCCADGGGAAGGVFLATAFFAGAFLAGTFFTALAGTFLAGGSGGSGGGASGSSPGGSCWSAIGLLLCVSSSRREHRQYRPSCQPVIHRGLTSAGHGEGGREGEGDAHQDQFGHRPRARPGRADAMRPRCGQPVGAIPPGQQQQPGGDHHLGQ
jgi:hypothetical protein